MQRFTGNDLGTRFEWQFPVSTCRFNVKAQGHWAALLRSFPGSTVLDLGVQLFARTKLAIAVCWRARRPRKSGVFL